jgi:hypothetical protein
MGKEHKWSFSVPQEAFPEDKNGDYGFPSAFSLVKSVFFNG